MTPQQAAVVVAVLVVLAIWTGIAYGVSTRMSGFRSGHNFGEFSVVASHPHINYPILHRTRVNGLRRDAIETARSIRRGPHMRIAIVRTGHLDVEAAMLIAILMALGIRYEDARLQVLDAGFPAPPLEYERELISWNISRIGGAAAAW